MVKQQANSKIYIYEHLVLLNETNAMGGVVYFSNFVKWQGMAREYILRQHPMFGKIVSGGLEMITTSCNVEFLGHLYFGDTVQVKITARDVLPTSFIIKFEYFNRETGKLVATGEQKVTFANKQTGQICRIPEEIFELAKAVEVKT